MHINGPKVWGRVTGRAGIHSPSLRKLTPSPLSLPSILPGRLQWSECHILSILLTPGFPGGSDGKESACSAGDPGSIPGLGRSPEKEMTVHSNILAWRIQWTEKPGGLQRAGHGWVTEHSFLAWFHQLHLRSSGIRSSRLGTPALVPFLIFYAAPACFLPSSTCRTTCRAPLSVTKSLLPSLPFLWVPSPNWVSLISV